MNEKRVMGIEKEISRIIAKAIYTDVKNPKINGLVSVIKTKITPDLKYADIYFSILNPGGKVETVLKGLQETTSFFRRKLSKELKLRIIPEIRVKLDEGIEYGSKISKILNELK